MPRKSRQPPSRPPGSRRILGAWLGLVLLAFNLVAGALVPVGARAAEGPEIAFARLLEGEHMVVCTAGGLVEIDPKGGTAPDHTAFCVFCLPLMNGSVAFGPSQPPVPAEPSASAVVEPPRTAIRPAAIAILAGTSSPRAPPRA